MKLMVSFLSPHQPSIPFLVMMVDTYHGRFIRKDVCLSYFIADVSGSVNTAHNVSYIGKKQLRHRETGFHCTGSRDGTILRGKEPFCITPTAKYWVCTIINTVRLIWIVEVFWRLPTMQQCMEFQVKILLNTSAAQKSQACIYVRFVLRYKTVNFSKYPADKIVTDDTQQPELKLYWPLDNMVNN